MVTIQEIRFGNTIAITDRPIKEDYRMVDLKMMSAISEGFQMYGIPVNDEILTKFGFIKTGFQYDLGKFTIVLPCKEYSNGRVYYNSWAILEYSPRFAHNIENIYFAITGSELKLSV